MTEKNIKEIVGFSLIGLIIAGVFVFFLITLSTEESGFKITNLGGFSSPDSEQKDAYQELNTEIFQAEKFQKLEKNSFKRPQFQEGSKNPFKSFEQ